MGKQNANKDAYGYYLSDPITERKLLVGGRFYSFLRRTLKALNYQEYTRANSGVDSSKWKPIDAAGLSGKDLAVLQDIAVAKGRNALIASATEYPAARPLQCEICGWPASIVVDELVAIVSLDPTREVNTVRNPHYFCREHAETQRALILTDYQDYA